MKVRRSAEFARTSEKDATRWVAHLCVSQGWAANRLHYFVCQAACIGTTKHIPRTLSLVGAIGDCHCRMRPLVCSRFPQFWDRRLRIAESCLLARVCPLFARG